jgi:hypothetical protein
MKCPHCNGDHTLSQCPTWKGYRLLPVALAPHIKDALVRYTDMPLAAWTDVMLAQERMDAAAPERSETLAVDEQHTVVALLPEIHHRLSMAYLAGSMFPDESCYEYATKIMHEWDLPDAPAASSSAAPSAVWCVENKTCSAVYATEELARAYVAKFPASVSGGMQVTRIDVIGAAPAAPAASPAVLTDAEIERFATEIGMGRTS